MKDPCSIMAYAYELQAGDEVDGHTVFSVDDPHRPTHKGPAWSDGTPRGEQHGDCTIRFHSGPPITCDRLTEFALVRARYRIAAWAAS